MNSIYIQVHPDIPFIDLRLFKQQKLIAASNCQVYLYTSPIQTLAVKEITILKCQLLFNIREYEKWMIEKLRQQYIVQSQGDEYIIQIYGMALKSIKTVSKKIQKTVYVCMEYLQFSLQDHINFIRTQQLNIINQTSFIYCLTQCCQINAHLQSIKICHGDIKPQNILINDIQNPTIFKFCDFEHMEILTHGKQQPCILATQAYQAPEVQEAIKKGQEQFNYNPFKAQVYSLGLCLIQMHPKNITLQVNNETLNNIEINLGQNIGTILEKMLDTYNFSRPDFIELLQLIGLSGISKIELKNIPIKNGSDILQSQQSNYLGNTSYIFEFQKKEQDNEYNNLEYDQILEINKSSGERESESENIRELLEDNVIQINPKKRKWTICCSKKITIIVLTICFSLSLTFYLLFLQ